MLDQLTQIHWTIRWTKNRKIMARKHDSNLYSPKTYYPVPLAYRHVLPKVDTGLGRRRQKFFDKRVQQEDVKHTSMATQTSVKLAETVTLVGVIQRSENKKPRRSKIPRPLQMLQTRVKTTVKPQCPSQDAMQIETIHFDVETKSVKADNNLTTLSEFFEIKSASQIERKDSFDFENIKILQEIENNTEIENATYQNTTDLTEAHNLMTSQQTAVNNFHEDITPPPKDEMESVDDLVSPMDVLAMLAELTLCDNNANVEELRSPITLRSRSPNYIDKLLDYDDRVSLDKADDLDPSCQAVYEVLQVAQQLSCDSIILDVIKTEIEAELGYELVSPEGQKRLAKAIAGAKCFSDLANVFKVPEYEVRHYFIILYHMLEKEGGIEGLKQILELQSRIAKWLRVTGYPNVPIAERYGKQEVTNFLNQLHKDFSWEKLFDLSHPALPLLDEAAELAEKITSSRSKEELAVALKIQADMVGHLREHVGEIGPAYILYYRLACVARDLGFMDFIDESQPTVPPAVNAAAQKIYDFMTEAVEAEYHGMTRYHRESLEHQLQMSMLDVNARMEFANKCTGCKSMSDLARLLNASSEDMQECYAYLGAVLMDFYDGLEGLEGMAMLSKRLLHFLEKSKYPNLPMRLSKSEIQTFFTKLQEDIPETYRIVFQTSTLPINEDPGHLADLLTSCTTRDELASRLGTPRHEVDWLLRHGVSKYKEYQREFHLLHRGVVMAHEMGLTSLHEKPNT